jgi:hypothetical protein
VSAGIVPRWRVFVAQDATGPDVAGLASLAASLFSAELAVVSFAVDGAFTLSVTAGPVVPRGPFATSVRLAPALVLLRGQRVPLRDAPEDLALAESAVRAMGGAGMDVLLARARAVWQWDATSTVGDSATREAYDRAATVAAGVIAQHALGPALLPDASRLVGLRGVRAWLEKRPG